MKFLDPLLRFFLESIRRGGKIRIFISEQLVRNLTGQQNADIRVFVNVLAYQIHADAGPDRRDIESTQQLDHRFQRIQHLFSGDDDLSMVAADEVRDLSGIFQIDGILTHTNGEGLNGLAAFPCRNGTNKGRIQSTGKKEAYLGISNQPFLYAGNQLFPDIFADCFQIVVMVLLCLRNVAVTVKNAVFVVMPGWEGIDLTDQTNQIFGFAGKYDGAVCVAAPVQRTNANGISCRNKLIFLCVIEDAGKFCVQHGKQIGAIFFVQRQ